MSALSSTTSWGTTCSMVFLPAGTLMVRLYSRVLSSPRTKTCAPLMRRSVICSKPLPKATTLCHWVRSFHSLFSSFQDFLVATLNLRTGVPFGRFFASAFLPIYPMIVSWLIMWNLRADGKRVR